MTTQSNRHVNAGYPNTYLPLLESADAQHPEIFDPALKHFVRAFRVGEPVFHDGGMAQRWYTARRRLMEHVLRTIAESEWHRNLVLRGSLLLRAWLGSAAREPADIDWVVTPETVPVTDAWSARLLKDLPAQLASRPAPAGLHLAAQFAATDDIWTYERAPGKRIVLPWQAEGLPAGILQLDFVYGESLFGEDALSLLQPFDSTGETIPVYAASRALSLAWKLLWLESDMLPQGKDLYDATLLAEATDLPLDLLKNVLSKADELRPKRLSADMPLRWRVDWQNFQKEYPMVQGTAKEWQARLARALEPTFTN